MKPIVFYYSRSGRTEKLARLIATEMHAEIIRIDPEAEYGNFRQSLLRFAGEKIKKQMTKASTPEPDLSVFDPVFVGFPIWGKKMPPFVAEFLSRCELEGKTIIPFATFAYSGIRKALEEMPKVCQGARIELPFEDGSIHGGDYRQWRMNVRKYIRMMEDEREANEKREASEKREADLG